MSRRLTTKEFIEKVKLKWNDKYDYSRVVYENDITPVIIICHIHGLFYQTPNVHYRSGCPSCGVERGSNNRKNNLDLVIDRFIKKHGDKYDYSSVIYNKMIDKVKIKCRLHDTYFLQSPEKHLTSKNGGCPKCVSIGKGIMSNDIFIEKSKNIHGDKYDYSKVNYIRSNKNITLVCKIHGDFELTPNSNLRGVGCQKCSGNYRYKIDELLEIYNGKYKDYVYDFSNYVNIKSKILVRCPIHSYFETSAELLLKGYGCSACGKKSIGEDFISKYLNNNGIEYLKQKSFDGCVYKNKMQFDFYLPEFKTCIEYDGKQHFEPVEYFGGLDAFNKQIIKDSIKSQFCFNNNIKLIRIPYYHFDIIEKILEDNL